MAPTPGTRIGPYEVTGAIGAGGMGEVYRGRDTKLNRDAAINVLPAAFAEELVEGEDLAERLARGPIPGDEATAHAVVNWTDELKQILASGGVR